jgi:hypothetical protein
MRPGIIVGVTIRLLTIVIRHLMPADHNHIQHLHVDRLDISQKCAYAIDKSKFQKIICVDFMSNRKAMILVVFLFLRN